MSTGEEQTLPGTPVPEVDLGPVGPRARYEFTPKQEEVIGDLAGKMRFVGSFLLALALLLVVQVIFVAVKIREVDIFSTINALIYGLIGFWTISAGASFTRVVETTGWDVPNVMDALGSLRKMYSLLFYMLMAAIVASIVLMITYRVR